MCEDFCGIMRPKKPEFILGKRKEKVLLTRAITKYGQERDISDMYPKKERRERKRTRRSNSVLPKGKEVPIGFRGI